MLDVVYYLPKEKFVYKTGTVWEIDKAITSKALPEYLRAAGMNPDEIKAFIAGKAYVVAHDADIIPYQEDIVRDQHGRNHLNLWQPPAIAPAPGAFPLIEEILAWLTKDPPVEDPEDLEGFEGTPDPAAGLLWLKHWLAAKIQEPTFVPKVAVLFVTAQGAGKGSLFRVIQEMLGTKNCAVIQQGALENKFNSRWIGKLAVLADEVKANDQVKDISDQLKVLIDGTEIEKEAKGVDQTVQKNRLAWVFASNDSGTPIKLEKSDRRFSVFANMTKPPPDYVKRMNAGFKKDRRSLTDAFKAEIAAFFHYLKNFEVDYELISKPANTYSRWRLINANAPGHETFIQLVRAETIDPILEEVLDEEGYRDKLIETRDEWDFKEAGVAVHIVYRCYLKHCRKSGNQRPVRLPKFSAIIQNESEWQHKKATTPGGKRVFAFRVPRALPRT